MTNFVLLYTGNVGSTPIVQVARNHPRVFVPVNEQFDQYALKEKFGEDRTDATLADTLEKLYRRETSPFMELQELVDHRGGRPIPDETRVPHIVFKWRPHPFEPGAPESERLRRVFQSNDVKVALLARKSLSKQAIKIYLSEHVYNSRHQQFKAAGMTEEEYKSYLSEQKDIRVTIDSDGLERCLHLARGFLHRTLRAIEAMEYFFPSDAPHLLLRTEDVLRPKINYGRLSRFYSHTLEDDIRFDRQMRPSVRKAGLETKNCANLRDVLKNEELADLEMKYSEALKNLEKASLGFRLSDIRHGLADLFGAMRAS